MPKCRWIEDPTMPEGRWFMPECMGGAHAALGGCTCRSQKDVEKAEDNLKLEVQRLSQQVKLLTERIERLTAKQPI